MNQANTCADCRFHVDNTFECAVDPLLVKRSACYPKCRLFEPKEPTTGERYTCSVCGAVKPGKPYHYYVIPGKDNHPLCDECGENGKGSR